MRFRNLLTVCGLIVMAVCASTGQTPSAGESGIEGVITISPANPGPTRIDAAASMPLANATFAVEKNNGEVTSFITDEQGPISSLVAARPLQNFPEGKEIQHRPLRPFRS